jgi:exodeoxyribonuclease V beta subunit
LASAIVGELRVLFSAACPLRLRDGENERPVSPADVFILTFTNSDSRTIGRALGEAGLDFAFYKQDKLFETSEAREILDVLRAICAPEDRGLRAKALLTRFFALDLPEVAACAELGDRAGPAHKLLRLTGLAKSSDVPTFFSSLLEETAVLRREVFAGGGERGLTNIMHVLELLQEQWAATHASLPELVDLLEAYVRGTQTPPGRESDLQRLETDRNAVQILTVHKAKGLEVGVVFVFGGTGQKSGPQTYLLHEGSRRVVYVGKPGDAVAQRIRQEQDDERSRLLYVAATRARYRLYLPRYPPELARLDGPYARMNGRLTEIVGGNSNAALRNFDRRRVDCEATLAGERDTATAQAPGTLDPNLLVIPTAPAELAVIRKERSGFLVTSYTAVKRARAGMAPVEEAAQMLNPGEHHAERERAADLLPGGAETGIFLHEILAAVSLDDLAARPAFPDWLARPAVATLLESLRRRHARPAAEIPAAGRLVHAAYTTAVHLAGTVIPALASAKQALREMEFLYPMPENGHRLLSAPAAGDLPRTWKIERGVVKGFIDLLFEHEGRIYVCDWKSDVLGSYDAGALALHCEEHYDVQVRLYTIAALRFASITNAAEHAARFGAVVFSFLRGRTSGDACQGIHCITPTWDEILAWEADMLGRPFWGLAP